MKIPLEWTGQSLGQWATNMLRNDKAPNDLLFFMVPRDLTDASTIIKSNTSLYLQLINCNRLSCFALNFACCTQNKRNLRNTCSTCMQHINNSLYYILQVPTSVITPGGVPSSAMGRSVANYSGHVLKLVPGYLQYAFPLFSVVIIWNGHGKFTPTQFIKANAVRDWKLGILTRHLTAAIKLFEEVEGDIYESENPVLFDTFFEPRDQVHIASQILGDHTRGRAHTIIPVEFGPRTGTSTDLTYPMPMWLVQELELVQT